MRLLKVRAYDVERGARNDGVQKQKRNKYLSGKHMQDFDDASLAVANAWLDKDLEAYLGYALFDNVTHASRPYDHASRCSYHLPPLARKSLCS